MWVIVGCVLWALGLFRVRCTSFVSVRSLSGMMLLLGVGLLFGVRLLLRALVVLGLSWDECGGMGIVTYRHVMMNDDFRLWFVVQLPRHCQ